jgi:hypothetical protein
MHGDILKLNLYKIFMVIFMSRAPSAGAQAFDISTAGSLASPASIQDVMLKKAIECWSSNKYVLC